MPKNVVCKKCNNLVNDWCEKVIDSPDQDMQRDCQYFCEKTNADRIRAMSDVEMAQEMIFFFPTDTVFNGTETYEKPHYTGLDGSYYSTSEELVAANLEWLQQPAEGE